MIIGDKDTRIAQLVPCGKDVIATNTAQFLWQHIDRLYGIPRILFLNIGTLFTAHILPKLWKMTNINHKFDTSYFPQTQGVMERMNNTFSQTHRCFITITGLKTRGNDHKFVP